ncbi:Flp family type IVb pilin [Phyllobacterium lublinensis]|jgi:pilus assembly protein Flp/PilA|uniref:Flp family type IVb pilin n=1 Tax=Phyllobacterium lublinensis TaxID=2875708 RepID=UPI001CCB5CA6|nr:Flp family type IVb pilin [Phyllobacterium sp. 2063]MBZ9656705.1 Flp family type IVb pilin [Phyllobacterium sp. 2063]
MKRSTGPRSNALIRFLRDDAGATAIEYTLIASLVSVGIIVGAGILGVSVNDLYTGLADDVTQAMNK